MEPHPLPQERGTRKPYRWPKLEKPRRLLSEVEQVRHLCKMIRNQSPTAAGSCTPQNPSLLFQLFFHIPPPTFLLKKKKKPAHPDFRYTFFSTNTSMISYLISLALLPSPLCSVPSWRNKPSKQNARAPPPPGREGDRSKVLRCKRVCTNHFLL